MILACADGVEWRLEVRPRHREYRKARLAAGKLHESGPFAGDSGGIGIDVAETEAMLANDPSAPAGIVVSRTICEWTLVFSRASRARPRAGIRGSGGVGHNAPDSDGGGRRSCFLVFDAKECPWPCSP